jgi:hypothetical protein
MGAINAQTYTPMQNERDPFQRMVNEYCEYFYKISTKSIFKPETYMDCQVIEFDLGVVLKISLQLKEDKLSMKDDFNGVVHILRVTSLKEAFDQVQLNIAAYLSEVQQKELTDSAKKNIPFFKGTTRFYGPTMDETFYIKEKSKKCWNIKAVENDLLDYLNDSLEAAGKV